MKRFLLFVIIISVAVTSCVKDRVSTTAGTVTGPVSVGTRTLIHYWNFNNSADTSVLRNSTITANKGFITYDAPYFDTLQPGSSLNARNGDDSGGAMRMRNPYNSMVLHLPTTGYTKPILTFAAQKSSNGPGNNAISYTTDGTNYITTGITVSSVVLSTDWQEYSIDFSGVTGADDNADFAVKFVTSDNNTGTKGNDRYDNITVDAYTK